MRCGCLALCVAVSALAFSQDDLVGTQKYPQFRVLSGLPGGGFGVLPNGKTGNTGAAALATPIGYTLGSGSYAIGYYSTSSGSNPFRFDRQDSKVNFSNGTGFYMGGVTYRGYHATLSNTILSTSLDNVFNFQVSPPAFGKLGLSAGVQDVFDTGGASGPTDRLDPHVSRSFYVVGTYEVASKTYVSLGKGERRFEGLFGNASFPISDRVRVLAEYDGFNLNGGVLYNTGRGQRLNPRDASPDVSIFLGTVRGKYGTIGIAVTL